MLKKEEAILCNGKLCRKPQFHSPLKGMQEMDMAHIHTAHMLFGTEYSRMDQVKFA